MKLFELDVILPEGLVVVRQTTSARGTCVEIQGDDVESFVSALAIASAAAGFRESVVRAGRSRFERGEEWFLLAFGAAHLLVQTYEPKKLPLARCEGSVVMVADLRIDVGASETSAAARGEDWEAGRRVLEARRRVC